VVKDNNGCIRQTKAVIIEAPVFNVSDVVSNVQCYAGNTGSVYFTVSGGQPPYQYQWSNGATAGGLFNLAAGDYDATVTDAYGCEKIFHIPINQPDSLAVSLNIASATCSNVNDGSVKVLISGGLPPYTLQWSNGSDSLTRNNLLPGNYPFTVTDANGCVLNSVATVTSPPAIQVNAIVIPDYSGNGEGAIYLNVTGGTAPYTYTWLNGSSSDTLTNLPVGNYLVQVTDANGCRTSKSFLVTTSSYIDDESLIGLNIFPNPAQHSINIELQLPFTTDVNVKVFNVLGEMTMQKNFPLIKSATLTLDAGALPSGNYFLLIEGEKFRKPARCSVSR
jgi:hypothetical protein